MAFADLVNWTLSTLIALLNIATLLGLLTYLSIKSKIITPPKFYYKIKKTITENQILLIFLLSLIATLGSLTYSEILGYTPCKLCWFQRITMYPIALISGIALIKKDNAVKKYVLSLAIVGALIALYHYAVQFLPQVVACSYNGVDCALKQAIHYGYITIPMMAFSTFIAIILITITNNQKNKNKNKPNEL